MHDIFQFNRYRGSLKKKINKTRVGSPLTRHCPDKWILLGQKKTGRELLISICRFWCEENTIKNIFTTEEM